MCTFVKVVLKVKTNFLCLHNCIYYLINNIRDFSIYYTNKYRTLSYKCYNIIYILYRASPRYGRVCYSKVINCSNFKPAYLDLVLELSV